MIRGFLKGVTKLTGRLMSCGGGFLIVNNFNINIMKVEIVYAQDRALYSMYVAWLAEPT